VEDFAVVTDAMKHVYSSDGREASEWVEDSQKGHEGDTPKFSSGLKVSEKWCGGSDYRSLGVSVSVGNNLMKSATDVYMLSGKPTHKGARHFDLLPSNWRRAVALYSARKLVAGDWINDKDEYLAPDESLPGYAQWVDDCHVYALLHTSNNCTAMRDVMYKGKSWRIKNHWFWRTRAQALPCLDTHKTAATYRDCRSEPVKAQVTNEITGEDTTSLWELDGDPYFGHLLASGHVKLSPDAQHVLDLLDALWVKSLPERESYYGSRPVTDKEPDLHLTAWDAGAYQLKHLFRDLYPKEWEELREAHKALAERLREGVYTYGFLRR
jgi:hypothetical protein